MKIYTVEISTVGGETVQAIFNRADMDAALSAWHQFMASCIANESCTSATCLIIDENGNVLRRDGWRRNV